MGDEDDDDDASLGCSERANEIEAEQGKTNCGLVRWAKKGKIYAYEIDPFGDRSKNGQTGPKEKPHETIEIHSLSSCGARTPRVSFGTGMSSVWVPAG